MAMALATALAMEAILDNSHVRARVMGSHISDSNACAHAWSLLQ